MKGTPEYDLVAIGGGTIFPHPRRIEGVKRAADAFQRARLEGRPGQLLRKWFRG